jgi:hypothetical protein
VLQATGLPSISTAVWSVPVPPVWSVKIDE